MQEHEKNDSPKQHPHEYGEGVGTPDAVSETVESSSSDIREENIVQVNLFLIVIFGALVFWGGFKIINDTQSFDPMIYNPYQEKITGPIEPPTLAEIGRKVFRKNCVACHQADGAGLPGAFPTLHETHWVTGSRERVINILLSGLSGPIEVNGNMYDGNMPPWGAALDDEEIAGVLTYIRTNAEWGNNASEITESEVATVRSEYGARGKTWTAPELLELFPDTAEAEAEAEAEIPIDMSAETNG